MVMKASRIAACWIACLLLVVVPDALAQVSQVAVESVRGEHLELELRGEQRVRGHVRALESGQLIFLADNGELHDLKLRDVVRVRVVREDDGEKTPVETPPAEAPDAQVSEPSTPGDESSSDAVVSDDTYPAAHESFDGEEGYLDGEDEGGYLPRAASSTTGGSLGQSSRAGTDASGRLYLNQADYNEFQSIVSRGKVQRIVGWTFVAVGTAFIINGAVEKSNARDWGEDYNARPQYVVGTMLAAGGLPLIFLGRRTHREAGEFARLAAEGRHAVTVSSPQAASAPSSEGVTEPRVSPAP